MTKALELLMKIENQGGVGIIPRYETQEAIVELQEAMKPKTCADCKHRSNLAENLTNTVNNGFCIENGFFTKYGFCCNRYNPKDNQ